MLFWIYYVILFAILVFGWLLNLLGLPGLWAMLIGHIAFGWATGWGHYVGWPSVITLFVLALAAEAVEFFAGAAGSKKAGGTRRGMAGAVIGGLIGGIVGSFAIPILILGTVVGAVGGSFLGAAVVEWLIHPDEYRAAKIGYGAAKGRLLGIILKGGFGLVMGGFSLVAALPIHLHGVSTLPATQPASRPATTLPNP